MKDNRTEVGGSRDDFLTTRWSMVLGARDGEAVGYRENLGTLIRTYWRPVYSFLRRRWGLSNENAKDATQGFFAHVVQFSTISAVDPEKGSFRAYLLACLRNFQHNQHDADAAQKRGGGRPMLSLEFIRAEGGDVESPTARTPEEGFDRCWEQTVVREAIGRMKATYESERRPEYFNVFEAYDLTEDRETSYSGLAEKFGIGVTDVTNYIAHARRRFRSLVEEIVRDSVSDPAELTEELRRLFGGGR